MRKEISMDKIIEQVREVAANEAETGERDSGVEDLRKCLDRATEANDPLLILTASRLLGRRLLTDTKDEALIEEGRTVLQQALKLAQRTEVAHEIKWLNKLLEHENN